MKIGALIPIRMTSERLPGKALKEICGRPVVHHLLDRVFASRHVARENVVVCTTPDQANDPLIRAVEAVGARAFRGSEDDIIDRLWRAVQTFGFDAFVLVDGDDPCFDPGYMDLNMDALLADPRLDIVYGQGLPLGLATKAIRSSALEKVWKFHLTDKNDTGFIYYVTRTGLCPTAVVAPVKPEHVNAEARLTLDYEQDLRFFREVFGRLYRPGEIFGIDAICRLLSEHPGMMQINSSVSDEYWARTKAKALLEYRAPDGSKMKIEV
jgi:spore coat polysaccharide biosynthesis protein SpsF